MEMQPKQLEDENPKLKGMADDLSLDIDAAARHLPKALRATAARGLEPNDVIVLINVPVLGHELIPSLGTVARRRPDG
jgi:hypothetical protein